jgi:hypothetical protein
MSNVVYVKVSHYENGIIYTKQKVCTVIDKDEYDSVTLKYFNQETKKYEIKALPLGQYSTTPYLMDFD